MRVAQLAKPLGVSTVIFDACANSKAVSDAIVENEKHCLTRKRFNKSDDAILAGFSEDSRECIDHERGDYCCKRVFPSRVNHCFFSGELRDQERKGVKKRARKKLKEAKDLEKDLTRGKKLKKRYWIDNVPIKATVSLPTKLSEIHDSDDFGDVSTILGRYRTFADALASEAILSEPVLSGLCRLSLMSEVEGSDPRLYSANAIP